jgi:hypothetical protein
MSLRRTLLLDVILTQQIAERRANQARFSLDAQGLEYSAKMAGYSTIAINVDLLATRQHAVQAFQFDLDGCASTDQTELRFTEQIGTAKVIDVTDNQIVIAA